MAPHIECPATYLIQPDSIDKARQCCFLCLQSQNGPYAIQVPCRRPEIEKEEPSPFAFIRPKQVNPTENASESDAVIWNRMLDMYYEMGHWKRWLPFYGPVSVKEVEFEFHRAKDQDGLYEIYDVKSVDIKRVKNIADCIIEKNEACNDNAKITMEYCYGYMHNPSCPVSTYDPQLLDFLDPPTCIQEEANEAMKRKRKISILETVDVLKECARSPQKANGLGTLDGMAQDSCIYNTEYVNTTVLVILV
ncbi:uncharacterized protein EURHEDRAFT_415980 [Aspergillus ruber CBS 135680]|uniref:Uncharacterized protein n=1 Tax=Aspergillus ruber (strain CBS 135680) TaxID=1388766 RepID=A0A017S4M4_ASPRC|nr:uncharacterized protein EURHEDRAFT_415980 [Aspergillus ruber CBS 135680]EYE91978.1 hypothetical protein EURHEDRAFT_415980 [Aspergillus ruber CBS 135680]